MDFGTAEKPGGLSQTSFKRQAPPHASIESGNQRKPWYSCPAAPLIQPRNFILAGPPGPALSAVPRMEQQSLLFMEKRRVEAQSCSGLSPQSWDETPKPSLSLPSRLSLLEEYFLPLSLAPSQSPEDGNAPGRANPDLILLGYLVPVGEQKLTAPRLK